MRKEEYQPDSLRRVWKYTGNHSTRNGSHAEVLPDSPFQKDPADGQPPAVSTFGGGLIFRAVAMLSLDSPSQ